MKPEERLSWARAAFDEVRDVPAVIFEDACRHARRTADHPAKIVPAIYGYKPRFDVVSALRRQMEQAQALLANIDALRIAQAGPLDDGEMMGIDELRDLMPSMRITAVAKGWARQSDLDALKQEEFPC
ncbi:hypothetical protein KFK14_12845 [Sphingobium phenoxybenzoativorans]|uniref:Uncharacterized protein n=1 Tax=Sphingobium phenoxybenzoativorans TaxID=1592790 RepID=A0A975K341_9SPHN|nr:hypothetical protein [Sphingobium phenoxybenzoativorans]QUT04034.1 hypothetical protein KFK14_12845 [Sphingobium phenoxybenzoativorans]